MTTFEGRPQVVVITGASSGIGRATALAFAKEGARVVVSARREAPLHTLVAECEQRGGQALAVPADTTDEQAMHQLARRAVETFGGLDVWVNNAAVYTIGRFDDIPPEDFRRTIETNFFGYVNGCRAALQHFKRANWGVIVNVASVNGVAGAPYSTAYASSKFAVRGFSEALRQDLMGTDISVCTILPASIDTPLFEHAANYTGRALDPLGPIYEPEQVASAIVRCASRPSREIIVGGAGKVMVAMHKFAPGMYERMLAWQAEWDLFRDQPAPHTSGNMYQPMAEGAEVHGGWHRPGNAIYRAAMNPVTVSASVGALASLPALLSWRRRKKREQQEQAA
ncbi:MAG TPA: SDR family oxidoreductase [Chloroflexota bacterium]|nr:SDR family oxidoreductase [Chloroflexota bacterium]